MFAGILRSGLARWAYTIGLGVLLLALLAPTLAAGTLLSIPGSMPEFTGGLYNVVGYNGDYEWYSYTADLEYAVFRSSVPALGLSGPDGCYIFTYQFFNHSPTSYPDTLSDGGSNDAIVSFELGLFTNSLYNAGSGPVVGYVLDPYAPSVAPTSVGVDANSILWNFDDGEASPGERSDILYFVSLNSPYLSNGSFTGNAAANFDGVPVPEPATGGLAIIGGIALLSSGIARRVYGRKSVAR